jgi:hypothetical protein
MRTVLTVFCLATLLYVGNAGAQEATGRVRGIYFEAARGVLVDASMLRRPGAVRWLDVELDGDLAPERKRQLVLLPKGMDASLGDAVALRLGEPKSTQLAEVLPAVAMNRALAVNPQGPQFAEGASTGASQAGPRR